MVSIAGAIIVFVTMLLFLHPQFRIIGLAGLTMMIGGYFMGRRKAG